MNFPSLKIPLGLDEKGANKLCRAIVDHRLAKFSKTHVLTLNHFLLRIESGNTVLHAAANHGQLDAVREALKEAGEKVTLEHLLRQNKGGQTPFGLAVREGHLPQIAEILKASGEKLTPEHFLVKSKSLFAQNPFVSLPSFLIPTLLDIAAQQHHLDQVFAPSLWANRVSEMMELWKHVPEKDRGQVDFAAAVERTIQAGLPPVTQNWNKEAFVAAVRPAEAEKKEVLQQPVRETGRP